MKTVECDLVSPRQLAKQSGWSERRIRRLIASKEIRHLRIGKQCLLPPNALELFLAANMVNPKCHSADNECNG
jgi:excisionase family DNA binding protein